MTAKCVITVYIGAQVFVGLPQDGAANDIASAWGDIKNILEGFALETDKGEHVVFNKDNCKQMIVSFKDCENV